jgi:hypothetical protein
MWHRVLLFLILLTFMLSIPTAQAHLNKYSVQVGAWGDPSSFGNIGLQVEVRTHIYEAKSPDLDYFWVGDILQNKAFVQFGYSLEPGYYCLFGKNVGNNFTCSGTSEKVGASDARWEWQYWPDFSGQVFYVGKGKANSAGPEGSWHNYTIAPNSEGEWSFLLDNQQVASTVFPVVSSNESALFVAEKSTDDVSLGRLGPVEFQNLGYLKSDGWHSVTSLTALVGLGINTENVTNPYGVQSLGPNHVIAGSNVPQPLQGKLLWTESQAGEEQTVPLRVAVLIIAVLTVLIIVVVVLFFWRRKDVHT